MRNLCQIYVFFSRIYPHLKITAVMSESMHRDFADVTELKDT